VTLTHLKEHTLHADVTDSDVVFTYTSLSWMMWAYVHGCLAIGAAIVLYDGSPFFPATHSLWTDVVDGLSVSTFFARFGFLLLLRFRSIKN
jgi:acetoacetyl-CoA synthetase